MDMQGGHMHGTEPKASDPPGGHGMAVVGTDGIFLSHLPMFMRPHDYQVILRASFGAHDKTYRADRKAHATTKLYTFAPQSFVLPELFPSQDGKPAHLKNFSGSLVRNHFEQPPAHPEAPVEIASDVSVDVLDVVHHHKFDPAAPALEHLTYVLFGKGSDCFVAHLITRPPDFDQLLSVEVGGHDFSDDDLRTGVTVTLPDRPNQPGKRIKAGENVDAMADVGGQEVEVQLHGNVEHYFETSDLKASM